MSSSSVRLFFVLLTCMLLFFIIIVFSTLHQGISKNVSVIYSERDTNVRNGLFVHDNSRSEEKFQKKDEDTSNSEDSGHCHHSQYKKRLPSAIIIGEQKCSTAAILTFLTMANPRIHGPKSEPHFFDQERNLTAKEFKNYKNMMPFSCPSDITMEKTPNYFRFKHIPRQMYEWNPALKLVLSLCDPIDRAVSQFHFFLRKIEMGSDWSKDYLYFSNTSFDNLAITQDGMVNKTFHPLISSLYDINLEHWLKVFPLSQIHIVDAGSFTKNNPSFELMKLEKYLGIEPKCTREMFLFNQQKKFYCVKGHGCLGKEKGHHHKPLAARTQDLLRKFFAPHVLKLKTIIGQSLSWMPKYLNDSLV